MAELLSTTSHIVTKLEEIAGDAKEYVYFVNSDFSRIPSSVFAKLWEALGRNVRVVLLYDKITDAEYQEILFLTKRNVGLFHSKGLNTGLFMNEKIALLPTATHLNSDHHSNIQFATFFKKSYSATTYEELLNGFRNIHRDAVKMIAVDEQLVSYESVLEKQQQAREIKIAAEPVMIVPSSKKLSIKEKQAAIIQLFERECKDCTVKAEGADRVRLYGKGIALALSKERVDIIFVHYDVYQSKLEDVKSFIFAKHPNLQAWFQYNRINLQLEKESEIVEVFPTLKEVVLSFNLITT
jgi:hypothetical protein